MRQTQAEQYGIDSHKLNLHPQRVAQWLNGEVIYPIYMEISPSGACNHRCSFCTMDFMGYRPRFLQTEVMKQRLAECGRLGVKAVMFAGEGEPLLHKDICELAQTAKDANIDISFTTNAVLLNQEKIKTLLPITSWIKVSCNATNAENYAQIHGTNQKDYGNVLKNMEAAVKLREKEGYACTLGFQCILLPESQKDLVEHAKRLRDFGVDYLVIKPYTHHPKSLQEARAVSYEGTQALEEALNHVENDRFKIIFRSETMNRWDTKNASYSKCYALPFWSYVDSEANVWGCSRHLTDDSFLYGNLYTHDFEAVWLGQQRQKSLVWCMEHLDISDCHLTCRMDFINEYLYRLKNPFAHDNFI